MKKTIYLIALLFTLIGCSEDKEDVLIDYPKLLNEYGIKLYDKQHEWAYVQENTIKNEMKQWCESQGLERITGEAKEHYILDYNYTRFDNAQNRMYKVNFEKTPDGHGYVMWFRLHHSTQIKRAGDFGNIKKAIIDHYKYPVHEYIIDENQYEFIEGTQWENLDCTPEVTSKNAILVYRNTQEDWYFGVRVIYQSI